MSATVTLLLSQLRVVRKLLEVSQKKQKNRRSIYLISNEVRVKPDTENATERWLFFVLVAAGANTGESRIGPYSINEICL